MTIEAKPAWLRKKVVLADQHDMRQLLGELQLSTVCQQALCPNTSECFARGVATFLILGRNCSRQCRFCAVDKYIPEPVDRSEPARIAEAVQRLKLSHLVITSPTRDDLDDGGASHFADTIAAIHQVSPDTAVETLIPDFQGKPEPLATVLAARPALLCHNLETVPRLYLLRGGADYRRSLQLLATARRIAPDIPTKTGIMLGMGETVAEVIALMTDARDASVSHISIGHYLPPSRHHQPLSEYVRPEVFSELRRIALELGFNHVESSPFTRSSYHAGTDSLG